MNGPNLDMMKADLKRQFFGAGHSMDAKDEIIIEVATNQRWMQQLIAEMKSDIKRLQGIVAAATGAVALIAWLYK